MTHGAWEWSQEVRPVPGQNWFAGGEPVVTQNNIGGKAVGNEEREAPAGVVPATIGTVCGMAAMGVIPG